MGKAINLALASARTRPTDRQVGRGGGVFATVWGCRDENTGRQLEESQSVGVNFFLKKTDGDKLK